MKEAALTPRQQALLEGTPFKRSYHLPREDTVLFEHVENLMIVSEEKGRVVLAISDRAVLVQADYVEEDPKFRYYLTRLGCIVAEDDRAAIEATIIISCIPHCSQRFCPLIINKRNSSLRDGGFTSQDLEKIYVSNGRRPLVFHRFDFAGEQIMSLANLERPIYLDIAASVPQPIVPHLLQTIFRRTNKFGSLHLFADQFPQFEQVAYYLALRETTLFDELIISDVEAERLPLSLFHCQKSVHRLVLNFLFEDEDDDHHDAVLEAAARSVWHGTSPRCLRLNGCLEKPGLDKVVAALIGPACHLEEINLCSSVSPKLYVAALQRNKSLRTIVFESTADPLFHNNQILQAIAEHPGIETIRLATVLHHQGHAEMLIPMLQRKRRLMVIFEEGHFKSLKEWKNVIGCTMSFNQFHCGVVDKMPRSPKRKTCFQVALQNCRTESRRTGLLLRHHSSILVEMLVGKV